MARSINIPAQTGQEEIRGLEEMPGIFVKVLVGMIDEAGEFIVPQRFQRYVIEKEMLADLMSANPAWAPQKPAGTYRNEDLWRFIDMLRGAA